MEGYFEMFPGIQVPSVWPCEEIPNQIWDAVQNTISHHSDNERVVLTINNVSTEVKQNELGIGHVFERIGEIPNNAYEIDLILPSEILLISGVERNEISVETENLNFYSLDMEMVQETGRREIKIAVLKIWNILKINGITGDLIYKAILKTTYQEIKIMEISTVLHQFMYNEDPTILVEKITENKVKIICFDQKPAPQENLLLM